MIKQSGIDPQDQQKNQDTILNVIGFIKQQENINDEDYAFSKFCNLYQMPNNESLSNMPITPPKPPRLNKIKPPVPVRPLQHDIKPALSLGVII
jgi:hypothetical protein